MNIHPSREEFLGLCAQGNVIPVYTDLMADFETPVSAYAKLKSAGPSYLLESVEGGEHLSRYSFIGCRPRKIFICGPQTTEIRRPGQPSETIPTPADPLRLIEAEMQGYKPVTHPALPRFTGGAVGFVGYEYVTRIEPSVPAAAVDELGTPLLYFMLSDSLLIFDRAKQTLRLCVNAHVQGDPAAAYAAAVAELQELYAILKHPRELAPAPLIEPAAVQVPAGNFTKERFEAAVESTKEYIRSGDIIQIVPSQRFSKPFSEISASQRMEIIDEIAWPVIDCHLRYVRSARYGQRIVVRATLAEYENRLKIVYEIRDRDSGERLTRGSTVQVAVSIAGGELQFVSPKALVERVEGRRCA